MKILIVDDSKAMRSIIMRSLRQAGFEGHSFQEASNGQEALQSIRSSGPDLVLTDWNMPEMGGIELLQVLRAEGNGVKVGFITSEGSTEIRDLALQSGALFVLTKPFTPDSFRVALKATII
jgi:two-component system chemotaxis response regulator CheY